MKRLSVLLLLVAIFLTACGKDPEFPIPVGVQSVRAVLKPVPFSLKRRGTHALIAPDGKMAAYAESTAVNLHALEGRDVLLEGIFEKNSDPAALPVLVVQKVLEGGEDQTRTWVLPALGLTVQLPRSWKGMLAGKSASFSASGFTVSVLTVKQKLVAGAISKTNALYGPLPVPVPAAELLVVGLRKATADLREGSWIVRVEPASAVNGGAQTEFSFALRADIPPEQQVSLYRSILQTVEFRFGVPASPSASSLPGKPASSFGGGSAQSRATGEGAPCGGSAGILCLSGMYCRITDPASESGLCTRR